MGHVVLVVPEEGEGFTRQDFGGGEVIAGARHVRVLLVSAVRVANRRKGTAGPDRHGGRPVRRPALTAGAEDAHRTTLGRRRIERRPGVDEASVGPRPRKLPGDDEGRVDEVGHDLEGSVRGAVVEFEERVVQRSARLEKRPVGVGRGRNGPDVLGRLL